MIDIILSVRNNDKYIKQSIESLLTQSWQDFKLFVADDFSEDRTVEIIESIHDKRIVFFKNKCQKGLTKNLNFLISQGNGEYVARLDGDDLAEKNRLEKQMKYLKKNNFDLVGCAAKIIDENGKEKGSRGYNGKNIKNDLIKYNMFPHSSWILKRTLFEKLRGYDERFRYAQDYDFLLRASKFFKPGFLNEKLISFRFSTNSISSKKLKLQQYFALLARQSAIARGDYPKWNYIFLIKPFLSFLMPSFLNKFFSFVFYGY